MKRLFPIFGIAASLTYIIAVIIGGLLREDYSHVSNAISELTVTGAPNKLLMDLIFSAYNFALILFGVGLFFYLESPRSRKTRVASVMLAVIGFLGFLMFFFPQDIRGTEPTIKGILHLVLAGIMSPLTILAIFLMGFSFGEDPKLTGLKTYSIASGLIVLVTGGITAFSVSKQSIYLGLFERLTIGTFMLWVFIIAIRLLLNEFKANDIKQI